MALIKNFERLPFYINYEECKSKYRTTTCTTQFCFILTMRNVNYGEGFVLSFEVKGFILTMRNVNICGQIVRATKEVSFILTMRNVNDNEDNLIPAGYTVLY